MCLVVLTLVSADDHVTDIEASSGWSSQDSRVSCAGPSAAQSCLGGSAPGFHSWQVPGALTISETALDPGWLLAFLWCCILYPGIFREGARTGSNSSHLF